MIKCSETIKNSSTRKNLYKNFIRTICHQVYLQRNLSGHCFSVSKTNNSIHLSPSPQLLFSSEHKTKTMTMTKFSTHLKFITNATLYLDKIKMLRQLARMPAPPATMVTTATIFANWKDYEYDETFKLNIPPKKYIL